MNTTLYCNALYCISVHAHDTRNNPRSPSRTNNQTEHNSSPSALTNGDGDNDRGRQRDQVP